jgi:modified peptide precursor CbpA
VPKYNLGTRVKEQPRAAVPHKCKPKRKNNNVKEERDMEKTKQMQQGKQQLKPISLRYTCAPDGEQVGLSHYLMATARKAK